MFQAAQSQVEHSLESGRSVVTASSSRSPFAPLSRRSVGVIKEARWKRNHSLFPSVSAGGRCREIPPPSRWEFLSVQTGNFDFFFFLLDLWRIPTPASTPLRNTEAFVFNVIKSGKKQVAVVSF